MSIGDIDDEAVETPILFCGPGRLDSLLLPGRGSLTSVHGRRIDGRGEDGWPIRAVDVAARAVHLLKLTAFSVPPLNSTSLYLRVLSLASSARSRFGIHVVGGILGYLLRISEYASDASFTASHVSTA